MTRTDGKSADHANQVMNVGVICGRRTLTSVQRSNLGRRLQRIGQEHHGQLLTLHHGCGRDADEAAHRAVRALGNWRIHGHPANEPSGEILLREGVIRGLNRIYESKSPEQRDADIVDVSEILIVIRDSGSQAEIEVAVKRAQAGNKNLIYLKTGSNANKPTAAKPDTGRKESSANTAERTPAWAARQARVDSNAGKACLSYEDFRAVYGLSKSDGSLQLWNAYHPNRIKPARTGQAPSKPKSKRKPKRTPRPRRTSSSTRFANNGLTLEGTQRRNSVKRYDLIEPRKSDLSPKNAALLMEVNQQNTLGELWR